METALANLSLPCPFAFKRVESHGIEPAVHQAHSGRQLSQNSTLPAHRVISEHTATTTTQAAARGSQPKLSNSTEYAPSLSSELLEIMAMTLREN